MEGACDDAVEDIIYREVRRLEHRVLAAETWSNLLNDVVDCGRKYNEDSRKAYAGFSLEAKRLCKDFSDVFPTGTIGMESTSTAPDDGKVYYGGPRPPE
ncbi:hypothetical protein C2845_PM14G03130 [Panicum miliaceum]|uniref:Uncharacterized protein n=1 Tax=Panicum miliaceum TaxID=4540 RepID=A0A3L6PR19_PANMI|nr:hypothetical protein C2845_PM14G03130 [Panicum miliaceum]